MLSERWQNSIVSPGRYMRKRHPCYGKASTSTDTDGTIGKIGFPRTRNTQSTPDSRQRFHVKLIDCFLRYVHIQCTSVPKWLRDAWPSLVMAFETDCLVLNDHFCIVKVFRPVSYTTVLAVLEVPVFHQGARYTHSRCTDYSSGQLDDDDDDNLLPDCAALNAFLDVESEYEPGYSRPVEVITGVNLYDTGVIHGNSPAHHQKVLSNILLPGATINYHGTRSAEYHGDRSGAGAYDHGQYVTAIQLLKMSALPSPPSRFGGNAETSRFFAKESMSLKVWDLECIFAPRSRSWHLSLILRKDEVDDFVYQVICAGSIDSESTALMISLRQMSTEARHLPSLLQNRISIELKGDDLPADYPSTVLARLREVYEENITSASQLLPRLPESRGDMLECFTRSPTYEETGSALVAQMEGDKVMFDCRHLDR